MNSSNNGLLLQPSGAYASAGQSIVPQNGADYRQQQYLSSQGLQGPQFGTQQLPSGAVQYSHGVPSQKQPQQQQQQQASITSAPALLAAIQAMQAAVQSKQAQQTQQGQPYNPGQGQQAMRAPAGQAPARPPGSGSMQKPPAQPQPQSQYQLQYQQQPQQKQQGRPARQPSPPVDHNSLLQQVQAALAKTQQQQQQPKAPVAPAAAEATAPASKAPGRPPEAAPASAAAVGGAQKPPLSTQEDIYRLMQATLQQQQQQRQQQQQQPGAGLARQSSTAAAAAGGQRPAQNSSQQQQLLQQVLSLVSANSSASNAVRPSDAPAQAAAAGAPAPAAASMQQPAQTGPAAGAAGTSTAPGLPPRSGSGLTPQQQQLLQQMLSAAGVAAGGSGSAGAASTAPSGPLNAGLNTAAGGAWVGRAAASGPVAAGSALQGSRAGHLPQGAQPKQQLAPSHTVPAGATGMGALLQQALQAAPQRVPVQRQYSQAVPSDHAQQLQDQSEGLSMEILTLLTMIAASAVYGAAESSASGRPLPSTVNPRVLAASKRFLSVLVSINDPNAVDDDEPAQWQPQGGAAAAAAGADAHVRAADAAAAEAAAAALCALPDLKGYDRSSSGVGGRGGSGEVDMYEADEPLVPRRKRGRTTAAVGEVARPYEGRPPTGAGRGGGRGGRGSRKPQGSGRSGLLALLRAVEENDGSSGAGDGMDWAADAGDEDADLNAGRHDRNSDGGRRGRGKRPRYAECSAGDVYSDSYSVDSADDSRRDAGRWDAARSGESDREGEEEQMPQKRRHRAGWRHGRIRRTKDENYLYGDEALDRVAGELAQKEAQQKKKPAHKPARAPSPAGGPQGPRRHRCVAGANQWVTEDGLIVWPKDTIVTRDQRVFYVAFKWVQEHWPRNVEEGEHIADVPITLYLDNLEVPNPVYNFKAKIRVYNTAAHLVISPYSKLAGLYVGCYVAGYAYNHKTHSIRVYLSREKPDLNQPQGKPVTQQAAEAAAAAAAAAAEAQEPHTASADRVAAAAAGSGDAGASADKASEAAAPGQTSQQQQQQQQEDDMDVDTRPVGLVIDSAVGAAGAGAAEPTGAAATMTFRPAADAAAAAAPDAAEEQRRAGETQSGDSTAAAAPAGGADSSAAAAPSSPAAVAGTKQGLQQQQQQQQPNAESVPAAGPSKAASAPAAAAGAQVQPRSAQPKLETAAGPSSADAGTAVGQGSGTSTAAGQAQQPKSAAAAAAMARSSAIDADPAVQARWEKLQEQLGVVRVLRPQGLVGPVDASMINNAVLSVSDALQLPDDLLANLPQLLMQTLQGGPAKNGAATGAAGKGGVAASDGEGGEGSAGSQVEGTVASAGSGGRVRMSGGGPASLAMQGWYRQLCLAVAARDEPRVTKLVQQLGKQVLVGEQ